MGSTQSKKSLEKTIFRDYERSLQIARLNSTKNNDPMIIWKQFLKSKIEESPYSDTPNWEIFRKPIDKWINTRTFEKYLSWHRNARFLALNTSSSMLRHKRTSTPPNILDLDKLVRSKGHSPAEAELNQNTSLLKEDGTQSPEVASPKLISESTPTLPGSKTLESSPLNISSTLSWPRDVSKFDNFELSISETNLSYGSMYLDLHATSSKRRVSPSKLSSAEELKKFLRKELAIKEHPVHDLAELFKSTYEPFFSKTKMHQTNMAQTQEEEQKKTEEALLPVKRILALLREFTYLIYKDVIAGYTAELNDEDQDPEIIIDQLVCQLIFDDTQSFLYQHITKCLQNKCKDQINYFTFIADSFRGKCLHQFDDQFKEKFMQLDSRVPYETVIKTVNLLKMIPNPYMKKDYITMMEQEMIESIMAELAKKGINDMVQLEPDDKFTIYTYCLVRSNYSNVVMEISFIEEFTLHHETNQAYARFKGCLLDYILSSDFVNFMKIEEEKRRVSIDNKSPKKCCR